eukprot:TRINITY_DN13868_c0_g1_i1.p1 TRINITY_DN13868_c0_g1~~TRINITY_DN13868_c0_g1_i1.p1  ORF type:complete len:114 (+),score=21.86 TRINITY_DN13868_c0_g1_i1:25-366(+)
MPDTHGDTRSVPVLVRVADVKKDGGGLVYTEDLSGGCFDAPEPLDPKPDMTGAPAEVKRESTGKHVTFQLPRPAVRSPVRKEAPPLPPRSFCDDDDDDSDDDDLPPDEYFIHE